jgi:hypothetical protein
VNATRHLTTDLLGVMRTAGAMPLIADDRIHQPDLLFAGPEMTAGEAVKEPSSPKRATSALSSILAEAAKAIVDIIARASVSSTRASLTCQRQEAQ